MSGEAGAEVPQDGPDGASGCTEPDCAEAAEKLYEYLDGSLDAEKLEAIEAHIHRCSPCLDAYDFHSALRRVVASKCAETMPPDLRTRLLGVLDEAAGTS